MSDLNFGSAETPAKTAQGRTGKTALLLGSLAAGLFGVLAVCICTGVGYHYYDVYEQDRMIETYHADSTAWVKTGDAIKYRPILERHEKEIRRRWDVSPAELLDRYNARHPHKPLQR